MTYEKLLHWDQETKMPKRVSGKTLFRRALPSLPPGKI